MSFVRVRDESTGHEYSVAESAVVEGLSVLKGEPAVNGNDQPLPPKYADPKESVPARNASLEVWQDYARTKGAIDEDLAGKSRGELISTYAPEEA